MDVLRVEDPTYKKPLLVSTTARELQTEELRQAYPHRWPVETLFYIGSETTATEKPRAWTEQAVERRIGLGLLSGSLLKAIAAMGEGLAMGPWDKQPQPSAGRLAKPTVCLEVMSLMTSSCGYNRGKSEQRVAQ